MIENMPRTSNPRPPTLPPQKLQSRHREIIRLHVLGLDSKDIAERLGVSRFCVNLTLQSPLSKARINELHAAADRTTMDLQQDLLKDAFQAQRYLSDIVNGTEAVPAALRAKTCESALDRAGFVKPTKNLNINLDGQLTPEDIAEINRRAMAASPFCRTEPSTTVEAQVCDASEASEQEA